MTYSTGSNFRITSPERRRHIQYKLVGYWLSSPDSWDQASELKLRLEDQAAHNGHLLYTAECERGISQNYQRQALWKALHKLVCCNCPAKPFRYGLLSLQDLILEATAPCSCQTANGLDGIIVNSLSHISNDQEKLNQFVIRMAELGKHLYARDAFCLSCCHPATKELVKKRHLLLTL